MAGPHSINQTTLRLPKPNWPADAMATSTLLVEINHTESEVGTCQLHWMHRPSLCSPWMERCLCLHGLLLYTQQIEQLTELHIKTIMERAFFFLIYDGLWLGQLSYVHLFWCSCGIKELFLQRKAFFNPLGWSSIAPSHGCKNLLQQNGRG